jgi:hypothetical protein
MCNLCLPKHAYHRRNVGDGMASYCKECRRKYAKTYYKANFGKYLEKRRRNNQRYRQRNRRNVIAYLVNHPCVDCGEADLRVLEFDHLDGKVSEISNLVSSAVSWRRVEVEIAKCVVRCANCHRRKTAIDFGWYKGIVDGA